MRSIIFDLDDTLYVNKDVRAARDIEIMNLILDRKEEFFAHKKSYTTTDSLLKMGISREKFLSALAKAPINLERDERLFEILDGLAKEYNLIVISNSPRFCVKETLYQLGVLHFFSEYYGADSFSASKPDLECFSLVKAGDICVGDDFKKDLKVPKEKGAFTILVGSDEGNPDYRIQSIYDLEGALKKLSLQ